MTTNKWITYTLERFNPFTYLLLTLGMTLSVGSLSISAPIENGVLAVGMLLLFFFVLRLMDEYKDIEIDRVAHPKRPLVRGLIEPDEAQKTIYLLLGVMFAFGYFQIAYLITTLYLIIMFYEFFAPIKLNKNPFLYACSHQIILFPLTLSIFDLLYPSAPAAQVVSVSMLFIGAFFTYEICRKLNRKGSEATTNYLRSYGPVKTAVMILLFLELSALSAYYLDILPLLLPFQLILFAVSIYVIFINNKQHKAAEIISTLSLAAHVWALVLGKL